jgi:hypothetical protein
MNPKKTTTLIKVFSISENDGLRYQEKYHEKKLKEKLRLLGIEVDFENIAHHGIKQIQI